ncbi:MAG: universal stress protein [Hyphomicrobium sp.]
MTFKTILLNLNHEERAAELIAAAAVIARTSGAHVVGLFVMPPLFMPSDVILPMGSDFYQQQVTEHGAQAERIKTIFERLTRGEPFVAEWRVFGDARSAYESIADGVIALSRAVELVIVSQARDGIAPPMLTDVPERVALESGRPVLVIPASWQPNAFGEKIAIAWNGSREAARATFDALPFLRRAKSIQIITAGGEKTDEGAITIPAADVAATLARHSLNIDVAVVPEAGRSAGPSLISRVLTDGADMLVMGAYGHSRMREFILGGATRDILKTMTVPVLMSH